jgi:hypothetical protein
MSALSFTIVPQAEGISLLPLGEVKAVGYDTPVFDIELAQQAMLGRSRQRTGHSYSDLWNNQSR